MESSLTSCQKNAIQEFITFINTSNQTNFLLSGAGGVGKTYLISHIIKEIDKVNDINKLLNLPPGIKHTAFSASTHKAASVLSQSINKEVSTVHSLFSLKRAFNKDTGEEYYFKPKDKGVNFLPNTLIFIEEFSMLNKALIDLVQRNLLPGCRIVWLGDHIQLPPVNETTIPLMELKLKGAELITPVRFNNTELLNLVTELRQAVIESRLPEIIEGNHIKLVDKTTFEQLIIDANKQNVDCKVIAWTNRKVNYYGKLIHENLFGDTKYNIGQKLVAKSRINLSKGAVLNTQTVFEITDKITVITETIMDTLVELYKIPTEYGVISVPVNRAKAMKAIKPLKDNKQWSSWYSYKDSFAEITNSYSVTCHQSQGSTYHTVFIDLQDIMHNPNFDEMLRLLYVSASRASHEVIFTG